MLRLGITKGQRGPFWAVGQVVGTASLNCGADADKPAYKSRPLGSTCQGECVECALGVESRAGIPNHQLSPRMAPRWRSYPTGIIFSLCRNLAKRATLYDCWEFR